ncbi:hypothetical protein [Phaeospirillum tilakii]|uniref:Phospholipase D-like domain-containing protein n=1 Tax=Phaeospirillum tilakii TaxID=741673 RepID=A0ABW5C8Q4_9PROT
MSYKLFEVPEGYETDVVLVMAPYFDRAFAKRIASDLAPKRIRFLVDDGSRQEDLDALRKSFPRDADVRIALGAAAGLVHLKGFYFEFVKVDGQRQNRKRKFLFGSANATEPAFSGRRNAELVADVDLTRGEDRALLDYLQTVVAAIEEEEGGAVPESTHSLRNAPTLYLPKFTVTPMGPPPGFDAWLQRGLLVAKYKAAQQFLTVAVRLNAALPADMISTTFAGRRLLEPGERSVVRYPYVGNLEPEEADEQAAHQWNARLGMWTHLGNWVSESCYRAHRKTMKSKTSSERQARIEMLRDNGDDPKWRADRQKEFLLALSGVWRDLKEQDINPGDFLDGDRRGVDRAQYAKRFDKKFESDLLMAKDEDFYERYVTGYEFPAVPHFRQDQRAWESFSLSWCTTVAVEASRPNTSSLLTRCIRDAFEARGEVLADIPDKGILKWLRAEWGNNITIDENETTVGEHISGYWMSPSVG